MVYYKIVSVVVQFGFLLEQVKFNDEDKKVIRDICQDVFEDGKIVDFSFDYKQFGVRQVEVIIIVWLKEFLIVMFVM